MLIHHIKNKPHIKFLFLKKTELYLHMKYSAHNLRKNEKLVLR
jgi:hypothetical protein